MKQRIYIDTSVFGEYFDKEFADHTIPLFDRLQENEFILLFSTVTQDELENAAERVKKLVNVQHIRGYNSINIKNGYRQLEIRTPREFKKYENY